MISKHIGTIARYGVIAAFLVFSTVAIPHAEQNYATTRMAPHGMVWTKASIAALGVPARTSAKLGDAIAITIAFKNTSAFPLLTTANGWETRFSIANTAGKPLQLPPAVAHGTEESMSGTLQLRPGQILLQRYDLRLYFGIKAPGSYLVTATRTLATAGSGARDISATFVVNLGVGADRRTSAASPI